MPIEGAQILKALQKVAGAAGLPSDFKVKFATNAKSSGIDFDEKEVVIGAGRLFQEAPIPADLFDVLQRKASTELHELMTTFEIAESYKSNSHRGLSFN